MSRPKNDPTACRYCGDSLDNQEAVFMDRHNKPTVRPSCTTCHERSIYMESSNVVRKAGRRSRQSKAPFDFADIMEGSY